MGNKLRIGDTLPELSLKLTDGSTVSLPSDIQSDFAVVLFYRGHWCLFCQRQLADFESRMSELEAQGISVYAASVDTGEDALKVANEVSFPIGEGVTREVADSIGAWWEDRRSIVQPSQFLIRADGTVLESTYSDGPLGRLVAEEVCGLVGFLKSQ
jgi:peroxiredoxin